MKSKTLSMRLTQLLAVMALVSLGLQACAPMLVGGFVGGTMVVSDRRSSGTQLEDEAIEIKSSSRIRENLGDKVHASVSSYNRQVLVTGEVSNPRDKEYVMQIVSQVDNVKSVLNELQILPVTTYSERSKNVLLAARVKANFVDHPELSSNAFKVVAEGGTVYLMGRVTKREADLGVDVTRNTPGVQKVIKVFEILTDDELRALLPAPAKR